MLHISEYEDHIVYGIFSSYKEAEKSRDQNINQLDNHFNIQPVITPIKLDEIYVKGIKTF